MEPLTIVQDGSPAFTAGSTLLLKVTVLVELFQAAVTVPWQGLLATVLAPIVREIEFVDPGTTAAFHAPYGATTKQRALPAEILRVGMARLVAPGDAVMDTLHVTSVVC